MTQRDVYSEVVLIFKLQLQELDKVERKEAKVSNICKYLNVRICCKRRKSEDESRWALENCDEHFSYVF